MSRLLTKKSIFFLIVPILVALTVLFSVRNQSAAEAEYFTNDVIRGPLRNVVNATGVVQTVVEVQVGSQVSGQILELYADFNSVVKRGQLLAILDKRNFEAQAQNARASVAAATARVKSSEADLKMNAANLRSSGANLEAARVTRDNNQVLYQRALEMAQDGIISQNELDNARANAEGAVARYDQAAAALEQVQAQSTSAQAQLEQTKAGLQQAQAELDRNLLNLEYCSIYSPVDGVVISRSVDVGQTLAASMSAPTLFSIATDLSRMQVKASVDEADIGNISSAETATFSVDAYPNDEFVGKIAEVRLSPQTVQNVVTYSVILSIDNSEMKLRPGMTANITITVDERDDVIKVPNASLRYNPPDRKRPAPTPSVAGEVAAEASAMTTAEASGAAALLAPGQRWNPAEKLRFLAPKRTVTRTGYVWVLGSTMQPEMREVVLGITDGSATEVLSGNLQPGDAIIVGDSSQAASAPQTPGFGIGFGGRGGIR